VKSVRANLLGGIEVTSLRLAVINSARQFFGSRQNDDTNKTIFSFHEQFAIRAFHGRYGMYSGDGVGKLKYDVCGETKFNGVSGNGGKDLGWIQPRGWGDISASVSLMRQNLAKAKERDHGLLRL